MIKSYKSQSFFRRLSFSFETSFKQNKWKLVVSSLLIVCGLVGGVIVATKTNLYGSFKAISEIDVKGFENGFVASSSAFLSRTFSLLFNILLLTACSFTVFTMPLAHLLLIYRGYLFGLNFALIFVFYGFGSIITAVLVILPCQLVTLFALCLFFHIIYRQNSNCKKYGSADFNRVIFVFASFLIVFLLNLLETTLLVLLSGKVILVL